VTGRDDNAGRRGSTKRSAGPGSRPAVPRIAVVVVSWNVAPLLRRCLDSLRGGAPELDVVVVDNASSDGTADMVRREHPEVTLLANDDNVGFTGANNQALRLLGLGVGRREAAGAPRGGDAAQVSPPDLVLLLNPDTEVRPGAIQELAGYLLARPRVAAVGPLLRNPDGTVQSSRRAFPGIAAGLVESTPIEWHWRSNPVSRRYRMESSLPSHAGPVDWVTGAALMVRSKALCGVGLFDEGYFMYSEELDLCRRLRAAGWEVHFDPRAEVVHHEAQSSGQVPGLRPLWFHRSRARYFRKHHGAASAELVRLGVLASFAAETCLEGAKWLAGHKRPLRRSRMAAYGRLIRDGLRERPGGAGGAPGAAGC
jgi:hypothetical protein